MEDEVLQKLLETCSKSLQAIAVFTGFIFFTLVIIGFIFWAKYYDKYLDNKKKIDDENIRRIVRDEQNR